MFSKLFSIFQTPQEREVEKFVDLLVSKTLSGEVVWNEYYSTTINGKKFHMDAPWDAEGLLHCFLYCDGTLIAYTNYAEKLLNACMQAKDINRNRMANKLYQEMNSTPS